MASTYSTNLAIELIGTGDQAGTWGTTTNTNLGTLIEQAISGYVTQAVATGTDTTITIPNGATGVARNMYIELTGTGGASTNLIVPANKKLYFIFNNTSSGQVTVKVSGQTGVSVPNKAKMILVSNGTDVVDATNYVGNISAASANITVLTSASATITNLLATSASITTLTNNPTFSGGTANGVLYLNGSKVATSGSGLTYNGSTLATTGALTVDGNTTLGNASTDTVTVNGYMGVGGSPAANIGVYSRPSALTGTTQSAMQAEPTGTSGATSGVRGFSSFPKTEAAAFTSANVVGYYAGDVTKGAGSTITNQHGVYITDQSQGTSNYGITSAVSSGANKWNIYASGTANNYFAGNVGIGTTSPTDTLGFGRALDIQSNAGGAVYLRDSDNTAEYGVLGYEGGTTKAFSVYNKAAGDVRIYTNGAQRLTVDSAGSVGIGVTPFSAGGNGGKLMIGNPSVDAGAGLTIGSSTTGDIQFADATTGVDRYAGLIRYSHAANAMSFWTSSDQKVTIDSSGNVGIGTTSPAYKLDVLDGTANGNVGTPIARIVGANQAITGETGTLSLQSNSNMAADTGGSIIFGGRGTTALTNSVSYGHIAGRKENGTSGNFAGYLQFGTSDSASDITERMRLDSSGNLGIGTSSPGAKLDVNGSINLASTQNLQWGSSALAIAGASNILTFYTNSAERMRLDSSGNLGLGVTPSAWGSNFDTLQVGGGTTGKVALVGRADGFNGLMLGINFYNDNTNNIYIDSGAQATRYRQQQGVHAWDIAPSGTAGTTISFTQAMTLNTSGELLLGTTSAFNSTAGRANVSINGSSTAMYNLGVANASAGYLYHTGTDMWLNNVKNGILSFYTNNSERARITSGGDLLVGKTASSGTTIGVEARATGFIASTLAESTNAGSTLDVYSTGATAFRFYVTMDGTVNATNTTISAVSDQRLKENIRDLDAGLAEVLSLKPRKFDWKEGKGQDKKDVRGFIAQEFEQVFPDLIDTWKDPAPEGEEPYKSVRQDLIPVLVKAIQELKAELDATKAKVAALEGA